jgi:hypothetical protein
MEWDATDFFCTTTLLHRYMDILFRFFSPYTLLVHRSFHTSSDSLSPENKLNNNKYNDVQPPTGPPSASLAPRFSNSSRREANKRWVRSAFGCISTSNRRLTAAWHRCTHLLAAGNELIDQHCLSVLRIFQFLSEILVLE